MVDLRRCIVTTARTVHIEAEIAFVDDRDALVHFIRSLSYIHGVTEGAKRLFSLANLHNLRRVGPVDELRRLFFQRNWLLMTVVLAVFIAPANLTHLLIALIALYVLLVGVLDSDNAPTATLYAPDLLRRTFFDCLVVSELFYSINCLGFVILTEEVNEGNVWD